MPILPGRRSAPTTPGADEKLRRIQAVTDSALSSLDLDDLLAELLDRTRDLLGVDTAAILLLDPTGSELVATAAAGLEEEVRAGVHVPVGAGFAGQIAARAAPVIIDHVDATTVTNQVLIEKKLSAMAGVPMLAAGGEIIGVLHVGTIAPRKFTDDDVELLRLVADRAAMAIQARASLLDRATTLALQRSLLPARPPTVDGFDVAARYIPGAAVGIGGDWYDLFTLPSGHIGVVIGDVAGSGLRAAVVMGRIRSALRAYALETLDPADVLTRLDRKIQLFEPGAMATACYAVIDPTHGRAAVSLAGHLPPLLITPDGADAMPVRPDPPLGALRPAARGVTSVDLPPGVGILLYTDGLVERRDQRIDDGIARLRRLLRPASPQVLCDAAVLGMLRDFTATDDIAILALRHID